MKKADGYSITDEIKYPLPDYIKNGRHESADTEIGNESFFKDVNIRQQIRIICCRMFYCSSLSSSLRFRQRIRYITSASTIMTASHIK